MYISGGVNCYISNFEIITNFITIIVLTPLSNQRLIVNSYKSVVSFDKPLMSKVFKNVFEAESFIIKVGTEDTQRFTGLQKRDLAQLNRFLEISSKIDACS